MRSIFRNRWGKRIVEWLGEASLGCLENSYIPFDLQCRIAQDSKIQGTPRGPLPAREGSRNWKKTGWWIGSFLLTWVLTVLPALAQELAPNQRWIEQVDAGFVFPVSPAVSGGYAVGIGGDVLVGYRFNRDLSLSADVGYYDCDQKFYGASAGEWLYMPLMVVARFNFGNGAVRPFLTLGVGGAENIYSLSLAGSGQQSDREMDFLLSPGAGILFVVTGDTALYFQGRVDLDFAPSTGPFTDNPGLFIPLKAGVSFFAL